MTKLYIANWLILLAIFVCNSCNSDTNSEKKERKDHSNYVTLKYAKSFSIEKQDDYKILTVRDPWQGASKVEYEYILTNNDSVKLPIQGDYTIIKTPIKKVICLSTSHVAFIDVLQNTESIVALSGIDYVSNLAVRNNINEGKVKDIGYDNTLNYELIASLNPDLVITYGIGSQVASYNQKLNELGIQTIIVAEYLEQHPLGKLEWIKLIAAFYDKDEAALAYFDKIEKEYNELLVVTKSITVKPTVLFGLPWKDVWYVPGGRSYLAKMVEDAGGNYLWKENESRESIPLGIETIFAAASKADVWLNAGTVNEKQDIVKIDKRFQDFNPYNHSDIYNNNVRINEFGGNDYWESGLVEPHIILKDMIKILHPDLLPNHQLVYYKKIE